jgi:ABC-2 type transport system permease protein
MNSNTLLVARREFRERIRSRGFILSSLAMPIFLIVISMLTGQGQMELSAPATEGPEAEARIVVTGYVDLAGIMGDMDPGPTLAPYADEAAAAAALRQGEIDAYYLIAPDYRETGSVLRISQRLPSGEPDTGILTALLRMGLVADHSPQVGQRLLAPMGDTGLEVVTIGGEGGGGLNLDMLPFVVTAAVMVPLLTGGGLLLRSLAQEKESRIIEVLLVSLRPTQLLAGKVLGMGALVAVQYLAWALILAIAMPLTGGGLGSTLQDLNLGVGEALLALLYGVGGFFLYAAIMAGLGAVAPDVHSSQNWVFIITLPMTLPFYLWMALTSAPNGPLAVGLSLFPFSAPTAMILRMTTATVPTWQIAISLGLMVPTAIAVMAIMARLFHAQVLLSGEPLSLKRFVQALRAPV